MNWHFHRRLSIAPMLDYTDRHDRYFLRLLCRNMILYSEMVPANALVHGAPEPFLKHDAFEAPLALQLGGGEPSILAKASRLGEESGFMEVNLNCGCPSDRVQNGSFGACLMKTPAIVADCVRAMLDSVQIPVTVKCRIGVDNDDSWEYFRDFIGAISHAGCKTFIVHARKAWLKGLSPKENREIPPLDYERVFRLKREFPNLEIILNGGIKDLSSARELLEKTDGVMIGRASFDNPWMLRLADEEIFGKKTSTWKSRKELVEAYLTYAERESRAGVPWTILTRPFVNLFRGVRGARAFRQFLSENAPRQKGGAEWILRALDFLDEE